MILLSTEDLLLRQGERELLRLPAFALRQGWRVGLVGANGSGKSSLLAILAGRVAPADGRVLRPPGVAVQLVEQATEAPAAATLWELARREAAALEALERELERAQRGAAASADADAGLRYAELLSLFERRGGFTLEARLRAGLARVELPASAWLRDAAEASGGERQRARLVGALALGADVLLLDEPSNHLDLHARDWLAEQIVAQRGAVMLASHDRALLDAVCTHVARIEAGRLILRRGGYAQVASAEASEARAGARQAAARARRVTELEHMAAELARFGHRGAQARKRRAERERAALKAVVPAAGPVRSAPPQRRDGASERPRDRPTGVVLRARHLRVDGILDDTDLELSAGQRIALLGPSGSGKSTVLALLAGITASSDPRSQLAWLAGTSLLHLDQIWRGLEPESSPRAALEAWVSAAQANGALAEAGLPHAAWDRPSASLSGGERGRAALALLAVRQADVVLLDEPTNDLDLPAIEALEALLCDSAATIVLASHDQTLVRALEAEVWSVEAGELVRYRGGIDGYRRGSRRLESGLLERSDMGEAAGNAGTAGATEPPGSAQAAADAAQALDARRAAAEAALEDPARWSARALARWRERRADAEAALLTAWEADAPVPAARYRTREAGVAVLADRDGDGLRVWLEDGPGLRVRRIGEVAHLVAEELPERSIVPWAWRALCDGAARLAHYLLPVVAVQVASREPLDGGTFEPLAQGWWVCRRARLERCEGWLRPPPDQGDTPRRRTRRRRARAARHG